MHKVSMRGGGIINLKTADQTAAVGVPGGAIVFTLVFFIYFNFDLLVAQYYLLRFKELSWFGSFQNINPLKILILKGSKYMQI